MKREMQNWTSEAGGTGLCEGTGGAASPHNKIGAIAFYLLGQIIFRMGLESVLVMAVDIKTQS